MRVVPRGRSGVGRCDRQGWEGGKEGKKEGTKERRKGRTEDWLMEWQAGPVSWLWGLTGRNPTKTTRLDLCSAQRRMMGAEVRGSTR